MAVRSDIVATRLGDTFLVRVIGHGTYHLSPTFRDFVSSCLDCDALVVVDLTDCDFLDSTFLGCLLGLHKLRQHAVPPRLLVHAPGHLGTRLFSTTMLDRILDFVDELPPPPADATFVSIKQEKFGPREMGEHIMHCHQRLAALGGRSAPVYRAIADRIAFELKT